MSLRASAPRMGAPVGSRRWEHPPQRSQCQVGARPRAGRRRAQLCDAKQRPGHDVLVHCKGSMSFVDYCASPAAPVPEDQHTAHWDHSIAVVSFVTFSEPSLSQGSAPQVRWGSTNSSLDESAQGVNRVYIEPNHRTYYLHFCKLRAPTTAERVLPGSQCGQRLEQRDVLSHAVRRGDGGYQNRYFRRYA